jgi:hypothetical protein
MFEMPKLLVGKTGIWKTGRWGKNLLIVNKETNGWENWKVGGKLIDSK